MPERDRVRVAASGELDIAGAGRLEREIGALLEVGFAGVVVDLRALTFIDSSGIHALMTCERAAHGRLSIVLGPGAVARTMELCGVRDLLNVVAAA